MALAIHEGGPADGLTLHAETAPQTRYYAPARKRAVADWVLLARYVFVPPRNGARCTYRFSGEEQVQGPIPGTAAQPDWS